MKTLLTILASVVLCTGTSTIKQESQVNYGLMNADRNENFIPVYPGETFKVQSEHKLAKELYLSPAGDDSGPGSKARPFRSLSRARDEVRKLNADMNGDIIVYLRGGEYPMTDAVEFGPRDGGSNGHKIIYKAFNDETPIMTGGIPVTGWVLHDPAKNIYRANIPGVEFRQLYVDGNPCFRARIPNRESHVTFGPWWEATVKKLPEVFIAKNYWEACNGVDKINEVEVVLISHWYQQRIRIGGYSVTDSGIVIKPVNPEGKMSKHLGFYKNSYFYFENALEFLDAKGEWYFDKSKGIVYLCMAKGDDPNKNRVMIPNAETLVAIRGTANDPVEDLEFIGITFECTNWTSPSHHGLNITQAAQPVGVGDPSWDNRDWPMGIIRAEHARRIAFRNNVIRNAGAQGIEFFVNVDDSDIEGNKIYQIAANGIVIDAKKSMNPSPDKQSTGLVIWNNHITKAGQDYTNGMGLFTNNVRGMVVGHNLINHMPYSGMQIGNQPGGMNSIGCIENKIINNHIHHCVELHDDGGGIYTLGGIQTGSVISGNYLHDIAPGKYAGTYPIDLIYLDNFTSTVLVKDNVVNGGKAAERNGSKGNTLINNTQGDPVIEKNAGIKSGIKARGE